tara:strand:- start:7319 stop:8944 length:1626 start_codon:yes stop_codon:yes gene_type:complete
MHRDESPLDISSLLKMKLLFSNDNSSNVYEILYSILTIVFITYISNLFNNATFFEDFHDKFSWHHVYSLFKRENKIVIEGKRCFKNGPYSAQNNNLFSFSFYAIWTHVEKQLCKSKDIYSIKECGENNGVFDDWGDPISKNNKNDVTTYVVNQSKPFIISDQIYCLVDTYSEDIESGNGSNSKISTKIENIKIKLFSYTKSVDKIKSFVEKITTKYVESMHDSRLGKTWIYTYEGMEHDDDGHDERHTHRRWRECEFNTTTSFNNIFFNQKTLLLEKIDFFINNKDWYNHQGKPYTLGIGLSGPPGTGKTSIIKSIAKQLNRHLIVIPLDKIKSTKEFTAAFYESRYNKANKPNSINFTDKIIVFEDIDCMSDIVFTREKTPSTPTEEGIKKEPSQSQLISTVIKACKDDDYEPLKSLKTDEDKLTLSFVLNVIDGIRETPGRIIIISSNYYDKLDKALVRPGRIDMCLNMKLASLEVIEQMFQHFYGYNKKAPAISDILNEINNVSINDIPDGILSQAEVVQCYNDDPKKFLLNLIDFKK